MCSDSTRSWPSHCDKLRDQEWRFGLRRRQQLKERQLLESLRDRNEHIQIKGQHSARDIDPAPRAHEAKDINLGRLSYLTRRLGEEFHLEQAVCMLP